MPSLYRLRLDGVISDWKLFLIAAPTLNHLIFRIAMVYSKDVGNKLKIWYSLSHHLIMILNLMIVILMLSAIVNMIMNYMTTIIEFLILALEEWWHTIISSNPCLFSFCVEIGNYVVYFFPNTIWYCRLRSTVFTLLLFLCLDFS